MGRREQQAADRAEGLGWVESKRRHCATVAIMVALGDTPPLVTNAMSEQQKTLVGDWANVDLSTAGAWPRFVVEGS
jgi:hypothetical protein